MGGPITTYGQNSPETSLAARLYVELGQAWEPLPPWARTLVELGMLASTFSSDEERLVLVVTVPTRVLAASMIAAGCVMGRIDLYQQANEGADEAWFRELASKPRGTPVTLVRGKRLLYGILDGQELVHGEPRIRIRVEDIEAGGLTLLLSREQVSCVRLSDRVQRLPRRQKGRRFDERGLELLRCLFPGAKHFESQVDCILVGQVSRLKDELLGTRLGVQSYDGTLTTGTLQDIVRAKRFLGGVGVYRTRIVSVAHCKKSRVDKADSPVVIFDGAGPFVRCRDLWQGNNWIAVLDRTDWAVSDAIDVVDVEYTQRRVRSILLEEHMLVSGMELLCFTVKRHG